MKVFVTGISGSGKTTLYKYFKDNYDIEVDDLDNGYAHWVNKETGAPYTNSDYNVGQSEYCHWMIKQDALEDRLKQLGGKNYLFFGIAHGQQKYFEMFDEVVLLKTDEETMMERLANRTNNNYGKAPHELRDVEAWRPIFEANMISLGALTIDSSRPVDEIAKRIKGIIDE